MKPLANLMEIFGLSLWGVMIFSLTKFLLEVDPIQSSAQPLTVMLLKSVPIFGLLAVIFFGFAWVLKREGSIRDQYQDLFIRMKRGPVSTIISVFVILAFIVVVSAVRYIDQAAINDAASRQTLPTPTMSDKSTWSTSTDFGQSNTVSTGAEKNPFPLTKEAVLNGKFSFRFDSSQSQPVVVFSANGEKSCYAQETEFLSGDICQNKEAAPYRLRTIHVIDHDKVFGSNLDDYLDLDSRDDLLAVIDKDSDDGSTVSMVWSISRDSSLTNVLSVNYGLPLPKTLIGAVEVVEGETWYYDASDRIPNFTPYTVTDGQSESQFGLSISNQRHVGLTLRVLPIRDKQVFYQSPLTKYLHDIDGSYLGSETKGFLAVAFPYRFGTVPEYYRNVGYSSGSFYDSSGNLLYNQPSCELSPTFADVFVSIDLYTPTVSFVWAGLFMSLADNESWNVTTPTYGYVPEQWGTILYKEPVVQYLDLVAKGKLTTKHPTQILNIEGTTVTHTLPFKPARPCGGVYEQYQWVKEGRLFTLDLNYRDDIALGEAGRQVVDELVQSVVVSAQYEPSAGGE